MTDRLSEIAQRLEAANRQQWFAIDMRFLLSEVSRLQQENQRLTKKGSKVGLSVMWVGGDEWHDEFLVWYKPEDWFGEHRAASAFIQGKLCEIAKAAGCKGYGFEDSYFHAHEILPAVSALRSAPLSQVAYTCCNPGDCPLHDRLAGIPSAPPSGIPKEPSVEAILAATRSDDLSHEDCPCPVHHTGPCFYTCVAKSLRAAYLVDASSLRT